MSEENPVAVQPTYPPLLRPIRLGHTAIVPRREHDRISTDVWVLSPRHPAGRHQIGSVAIVSSQYRMGRKLVPASAPWENTDLPEQVCVVEIDPGVSRLRVLHFHNRATAIARLTSGGRNVAQLTEVGSARAPADHYAYLFLLQKLADPFHEGLGIVKVVQDHGIAQDVALEKTFVELLPAAERATGYIPRQME